MSISENLTVGNRLDWINYFVDMTHTADAIARKESGLNLTQCRILFYSASHPGVPIGNIASSLFLKASTITAAVDVLEKGGYLYREYNDLDHRNVCISSTNKGAETAPIFFKIIDETYKYARKRFSDEGWETVKGFSVNPMLSEAHVIDFKEQANLIARTYNLGTIDDKLICFVAKVCFIETLCGFLSKLANYDRSYAISANESRILRTLGNSKASLRLSTISDSIHIRPNVATVSVAALVDAGLLSRGQDPHDRRAAAVSLTRKGKKLLCDKNPGFNEIFDTTFPGLYEHDIISCFAED